MKIHGICLVKNEGDFIQRSLRHDLTQFDHIYVLDNGSTDNTWAEVRALAGEFPDRLIPWKSEDADFRDDLRGEIFHHFCNRASPGDWWCRLDADEIYVDDPRAFLRSVPTCHHVVWSIHFQYYFSEIDAARWEADPVAASTPKDDFSDLPASYVSNAGEARFFRHRDGLAWHGAWPSHIGIVHPERIRLKHYQYRSPSQIQRRLHTRREAAARGYQTFLHSLENDWKEKIVNSAEFHQDDFTGSHSIDFPLLPNHLESKTHRFLKHLMHGIGLWK